MHSFYFPAYRHLTAFFSPQTVVQTPWSEEARQASPATPSAEVPPTAQPPLGPGLLHLQALPPTPGESLNTPGPPGQLCILFPLFFLLSVFILCRSPTHPT